MKDSSIFTVIIVQKYEGENLVGSLDIFKRDSTQNRVCFVFTDCPVKTDLRV